MSAMSPEALFAELRAAMALVEELAEGRPTGVLMSSADGAAFKAGTLVMPPEVTAAVKKYASGGPALLVGIPIYIDESCAQPRLDWSRCPVCYPDQPEWSMPEHCPTHKPGAAQ